MYCVTTIRTRYCQREARDLLGDSAAKLPADTGLDCEHDVVHFYLARAPSVFCIDIRVCEDMGGISVGEVEELVEDGGLDVLD
jgi:hypothetical protein